VLSHYILFRPQNDNISHGTPPAAWARESQLLADEVLEASRRAGADKDYLSRFQSNARSHIGRSTANQFIWSRLRGASRMQTLKWIPASLPYLDWNPTVLSRLAAALIIPRKMLRRLLLKSAAKQAKSRQESIGRSPESTPQSKQ
jgi:hypothetical protein